MKYQYTSQGFKNDFFGSKNGIQFNAVSVLILLNVLIFFVTNLFELQLNSTFGISNYNFKIWQLVTYMFLHGGTMHLFFNMFLLWMFGSKLEQIWGPYKFLEYYFFTGIGSGIIIYIFSNAITIGASGAIMAVLFSYGYLFPNRMLLFYFIPMKAKYCIMILIILEISQEILRADNISHIGHLGGMLCGFFYLRYYKLIKKKLSFIKIRKVKNKSHKISKINVDHILDKLKMEGWDGLTEGEKAILFSASKNNNKHNHLN